MSEELLTKTELEKWNCHKKIPWRGQDYQGANPICVHASCEEFMFPRGRADDVKVFIKINEGKLHCDGINIENFKHTEYCFLSHT